MKKSYVIGLLGFIILMILIATFSYRMVLTGRLDGQQAGEDSGEALAQVGAMAEQRITNHTKYILENCNDTKGTLQEEYLPMDPAFIGMNRAELLDWLENYEDSPHYADIEQGFLGYDLISFSSDCIVLRKTYQDLEKPGKYCLKEEDGYVVVYYMDLKTVYAYTDIKVAKLPRALQREIAKGKYIEDQEHLYSFLESYSS